MKLQYLAIIFEMGDHDHEVWQALLSEWPFESFHDEENTITAYIPDHDISEGLIGFISEKSGVYFVDYQLQPVPDKNWNEVWESSFNPVAVNDYCYIMASFHQPVEKKYKHVITISPKMAFGTGHHATTFMMVKAMSGINFKDMKVLDFGCGTGILSVIAAKEGAAQVIGVDIQTEAIENSIEHAELNGVSRTCSFYLGGLDCVAGEKFDVILANINRNVILENLSSLKEMLNGNGILLISGIMTDDVDKMKDASVKNALSIYQTFEKDKWVQMSLHHA